MVPSPRSRMAGSTSLATRNGPLLEMCCAVSNTSNRGVFQQFHFRRQVAPVDVTRVVHQDVRVAGLLADLGEGIGDGFGYRQVEFHDDAVAALLVDGGLQRDALEVLRVVSTVRKPSWANFWATAPPTPQRTPTGRSLSSISPPCINCVLRPSDCHLEVAPITTATGLRFVVISIPFLTRWRSLETCWSAA